MLAAGFPVLQELAASEEHQILARSRARHIQPLPIELLIFTQSSPTVFI